MNIYYEINTKTATLADQEYALKEPWLAYDFVLLNIPGTDFEKCQEVACKSQHYAYLFAKDIPGADIEYCQEAACKNPYDAYYFAKNISGANIKYCRKACESDPEWLKEFDKMITEKVLI